MPAGTAQPSRHAARPLAARSHSVPLAAMASRATAMAIRAAMKGQTYVTPALTAEVLQAARQDIGDTPSEPLLTPRQREILQLLAEGNSAKQIAEKLAISPRTAEFHKYQIMERHSLRNTTDLIHFAMKCGIVTT